jgi:hypothetical protein
MADKTVHDKRLDMVKQRLQEELVDDEGRPPEPADVASVVDAKAEPLSEAPVQEFVPLLIEHQARDELRQKGLHRNLPAEETPKGRDEQTVEEPPPS